MLRKPNGYDAAVASSYGERKYIPAGWYCGVILNAAEGETANGSPYIEFAFDVIDGEYVRYYEKDYKAQTGDKKWRGNVRYFTTEKALPMFKGAIKSVEESNPGYVFDWNEASLKGKKVGVGIRRRQYEGTDGQLHFASEPYAFCDIKKVISHEMPEPQDRLIQTNAPAAPTYNTQSYAAPAAPNYAAPAAAPSYPPLTELADDEELPF